MGILHIDIFMGKIKENKLKKGKMSMFNIKLRPPFMIHNFEQKFQMNCIRGIKLLNDNQIRDRRTDMGKT